MQRKKPSFIGKKVDVASVGRVIRLSGTYTEGPPQKADPTRAIAGVKPRGAAVVGVYWRALVAA